MEDCVLCCGPVRPSRRSDRSDSAIADPMRAISRIRGLAGALRARVVCRFRRFFHYLRACLDCNERIVVIEAGARH